MLRLYSFGMANAFITWIYFFSHLMQVVLIGSFRCFACSIGGIAYSNAFFGAGTGPIYLDDVGCTLSANQLLECPSRPILVHDCQHSADAGVRCEGKAKP